MGGDNGGRVLGTTIKDTWTKPRQKVETRKGGGFCCGWEELWRKLQTIITEQQQNFFKENYIKENGKN